MARPERMRTEGKSVFFFLSNMPEHECVIDEEDFPLIQSGSYFARKENKKESLIYLRRTINYTRPDGTKAAKTGHLHRDILGVSADSTMVVDHKNGNGLDNRRTNLRIITKTENKKNTEKRRLGLVISHRGITLCRRRNRYQSFDGVEYVGSSKSVEGLKVKIDEYLAKKHEKIIGEVVGEL